MEMPSWVNRAARMAGALGMGGGGGAQAVDLDGRPLRAEDTAALVLDPTCEDVCLDAVLAVGKLAVLGAKPSHTLASIVPIDAKGKRVQLASSAVLSSDADEQLLLLLPFTRPVRVRSVLLRLSIKHTTANPAVIKLYADQPNLSFSDIEEVTPAFVWQLPQQPDRAWSKVEQKQGVYEAVLQLQGARFNATLACLTLFIESNHGATNTHLHGITIVGRDK